MFGYGDKFIHKIEVPYTNMETKTKKMASYLDLLHLYEEFARGLHSHAVICYCDWGTCHFHWFWYKD